MSPSGIDDYVHTRRSAGGDLYTLHADAPAGLDPDLILTQDLCRVCALPSGHVDKALEHLGCRAGVLSPDPATLEDVLGTFLEMAGAVGGTSFTREGAESAVRRRVSDGSRSDRHTIVT